MLLHENELSRSRRGGSQRKFQWFAPNMAENASEHPPPEYLEALKVVLHMAKDRISTIYHDTACIVFGQKQSVPLNSQSVNHTFAHSIGLAKYSALHTGKCFA